MATVAELGEYTEACVFYYCFLVLSFEVGSCCRVHAGFELKSHPASAPQVMSKGMCHQAQLRLYVSFKWVDGMLCIFDLSKTVK